ncbi:hypothetical protein [Streptomyces fulvorobeus]|uniref:Uncharacterized protein n=1 Tax=Streptomyces fulvorobeus TaxID=284028 RepID=A0A7J0CDZ6_9ACTN|nr:hypothetical protein [Streptomyces fulvorobeus]NYE44226.1 hypothetical protein [Streptomyces fulvorobeus]GFN00741.1 hypothetical protein Sfulv_55510 [Streptomyces fulvorobeus]
MAQIKSTGTVDIELTFAELELVRRALGLVNNYGPVDDMDPARALLADLEATS